MIIQFVNVETDLRARVFDELNPEPIMLHMANFSKR
jgi:hypothetical protein